jgi:hypothetical protein
VNIAAPDPDPQTGNTFFYGGPPCSPQQVTIRATVTEAESGIASVTLLFQPTGGSVGSLSMGSIGSNTWEVILANPGGWDAGQVTYWVQARDGVGNLSGNVFGNELLYNGECFL